MGTAIEGECEEVMGVVSRCFEALKKDCRRIYMTIKVDYRVGETGRMEGKMKTVERKFQREMKNLSTTPGALRGLISETLHRKSIGNSEFP